MVRTVPSFVVTLLAVFVSVDAFPIPTTTPQRAIAMIGTSTMTQQTTKTSTTALNILKEKTETEATIPTPSTSNNDSVEATTEKYGLEAGLFQSIRSGDGGESAKSLLKKYGIAYLATSIPLALVSFGICYLLVDNGVDVSALLSKVGIESGGVGEKAGTVAIAYAAHKAASPIRFPPTVLLTPIVAKAIGKEVNEE